MTQYRAIGPQSAVPHTTGPHGDLLANSRVVREAQMAAVQDDGRHPSSALEAVLARISAQVTAEAAAQTSGRKQV